MIYQATGVFGLDIYTITSGAKLAFDPTISGQTLAATTYYIPLGGERAGAPLETVDLGLQLKWAQAVTGTGTIEVCNYPKTLSGQEQGGLVVSDYDSSTPGYWSLLDPTLAGPVYAVATGASNSMAKYTLTLGGAAAGLAAWNIPDLGWRRVRLKLVLTVGGVVWATGHGKLGA